MRELKPVTPALQCGDCWAWVAAEALASLTAIISGKPAVLPSTQQLTSCIEGTTGCNNCDRCGSNIQTAFNYIENNGIASNASYPFVGMTYDLPYPALNTDQCNTTLAAVKNQTILGYCTLPANNVAHLKTAVAFQPVAVAVAASSSVWQHYQGGIVSDAAACGTALDHAVVVVGYDTTAPIPYWLLQNQWGTAWGEDGFIRLAMSTAGGPEGMCAMLSDAVIPIESGQAAPLPPPALPSPPNPPPLPGAATSLATWTSTFCTLLVIVVALMIW